MNFGGKENRERLDSELSAALLPKNATFDRCLTKSMRHETLRYFEAFSGNISPKPLLIARNLFQM